MKQYYSVDPYGLKNSLRLMSNNERITFLYGIQHSYKDNIKGHYVIDEILHIDKENNKYHFVSNIFFDGHKLIDKICKKLNLTKKKWLRILIGLRIDFTYDEICKIIDEMPNFFDDTDFIGEDKINKYISLYKSDVEKELQKMRRPYEIYLLKKKISFFEKFHESIEDKKKRLEILEKLENGEDII